MEGARWKVARRARAAHALAVLLALSTQASPASADGAPPPLPTPPHAGDGATSPKRPLPDYDGLPAEPPSAAEVPLWGARVLLSPLYLTSEYLLRRPLGFLTIEAERIDLPRKAYNFFAFGPDHKLGFVPVGFVEFGFRPSVGIYAFWEDAFFLKNNQLHLHYEVWPDEWFAGVVQDRITVGDHSLQLRVSGVRRPDLAFYGVGPATLQSSQSRYTELRLDASALFETRFWRSSRLSVTAGFRKVSLSPGHDPTDPSIEQRARTGAFPLPYGFNREYLAPYTRLLATLDTRPPDRVWSSGVRLELQGEQGTDVRVSPAASWIRWGATATGFLDLNDHARVVSLSVATLFLEPIDDAPVPFTELVSLGGDKWMHGYFPGRFVGQSAAVTQLQYTWPIGPWLGGTLQAAVGNVFGEHLDGFAARLLRFSGAIGIATKSDPSFQLLVGMGTDTFERGASVDSGRVSFGVPHSF